jgi:hypothetical protein
MKVRFTMPVRGTLQIENTGEITSSNMVFRFSANQQTGFVDQLEVEMLDVLKENWPTLTRVEQDPNGTFPRFPFDTNPNAIQLNKFVPQIINLESLLSVFGLEEIDIALAKHEWISEPNDEETGILASMKLSKSEPEPVADPLSNETLARAIQASAGLETETAGLAHFRAGHALHRCVPLLLPLHRIPFRERESQKEADTRSIERGVSVDRFDRAHHSNDMPSPARRRTVG